jgi:hypothetical protein
MAFGLWLKGRATSLIMKKAYSLRLQANR